MGDERIVFGSGTVTLEPGMAVDLGGIAKGYASDRLAELFAADGVSSAMVSLGGNVYVRGTKRDGSLWRVAIEDPNDTAAYLGVLSLQDRFIITSGGYQRYFERDGVTYYHIIDPKNRRCGPQRSFVRHRGERQRHYGRRPFHRLVRHGPGKGRAVLAHQRPGF